VANNINARCVACSRNIYGSVPDTTCVSKGKNCTLWGIQRLMNICREEGKKTGRSEMAQHVIENITPPPVVPDPACPKCKHGILYKVSGVRYDPEDIRSNMECGFCGALFGCSKCAFVELDREVWPK
jgi:hypothetical protein